MCVKDTVKYTNRKGVVYHLVEGTSKTGKPRYQFTRQVGGKAVDAIPEGFEIAESVNGVVSLTKIRPSAFAPEEIEVVRKTLASHPRGSLWKVVDKRDRIAVYERSGTSIEEIVASVGNRRDFSARRVRENAAAIAKVIDQSAQYHETLRFMMVNPLNRTFVAERYYYTGMGGWMMISAPGPIKKLAEQLIPKLGTDAWFEFL